MHYSRCQPSLLRSWCWGGQTHLEIVTGRELLVDSAGLGSGGAKSNSLGPLLLLCQPPPGVTGWDDGLVDVDVASAKTTDAWGNDGDGVGAFTSVSGQ